MFTIYANKNGLMVREREPMTSGSVRVYKAHFECSSYWDGFDKIAVFSAGSVRIDVALDETGTCYIPWEVLTTPRLEVIVGLYGLNDSQVLPTVWGSLGTIETGVIRGDAGIPEPSPSIYEQLSEKLNSKGDSLHVVEVESEASSSTRKLQLLSGERVLSEVELPATSTSGGASDPSSLSIEFDEKTRTLDLLDGDTILASVIFPEITLDESLKKVGDVLSVTNPVRFATREEYDALADEEKAGLYVVDNGESVTTFSARERQVNALDMMPVGTIIMSLDPITPAGWHPFSHLYIRYGDIDHEDLVAFFEDRYGEQAPWGWADEERGWAIMPVTYSSPDSSDGTKMISIPAPAHPGAKPSLKTVYAKGLKNLPETGEDDLQLSVCEWNFYIKIANATSLDASDGESGGTPGGPQPTSRYELYFDGVLVGGNSAPSPSIQNHEDLSGRDAVNQHPISAITGLDTALASKADGLTLTNRTVNLMSGQETLSSFNLPDNYRVITTEELEGILT